MYKKATAIAVAFFVYTDLCTNIYKIKWHTDECVSENIPLSRHRFAFLVRARLFRLGVRRVPW